MQIVTHGLSELPTIVEIAEGETVEQFIKRLQAESEHDLAEATLALRDAEEDLALAAVLTEVLNEGDHVHVGHKCRHIDVTVRHGTNKTEKFKANKTIGHILKWAEGAFGIIPSQRGEYRLKLPTGTEYLENELHIGELVPLAPCEITLDLVRAEHNAGADVDPVVLKHLDEVPYQRGQREDRWSVACLNGAIVIVLLRAVGRKIGLRLDLTGYPDTPPQGVFWDTDTDARLADNRWPNLSGGNQAFRKDWAGGLGLYIACDRSALKEGHAEWGHDHPNTNWRPNIGIARYLTVVVDLLEGATFEAQAA